MGPLVLLSGGILAGFYPISYLSIPCYFWTDRLGLYSRNEQYVCGLSIVPSALWGLLSWLDLGLGYQVAYALPIQEHVYLQVTSNHSYKLRVLGQLETEMSVAVGKWGRTGIISGKDSGRGIYLSGVYIPPVFLTTNLFLLFLFSLQLIYF